MKVDKNEFGVGSFQESVEHSRTRWSNTSAAERLRALEFLRSQVYPDATTAPRLQRVFEITSRQ